MSFNTPNLLYSDAPEAESDISARGVISGLIVILALLAFFTGLAILLLLASGLTAVQF